MSKVTVVLGMMLASGSMIIMGHGSSYAQSVHPVMKESVSFCEIERVFGEGKRSPGCLPDEHVAALLTPGNDAMKHNPNDEEDHQKEVDPSITFNGHPGVGIPVDLHFEINSARLAPTAKGFLSKLANVIKANTNTAGYSLIGHTDASGRREYNMTLSERRARSVLWYLVRECGLDAGRFQVDGKGPDEPAPGRSPYSSENRRVVIFQHPG